ncbi:hypothetical protein [Nonomuraea turkmeniaca]|uniref:hypothetical protein n=1 Tax=Nonomuraea turkmeniaca TaxID=103838 RepID=UPI001476C3F6|nr:hypothetical protein [Nonomuraea turkmeniaca]
MDELELAFQALLEGPHHFVQSRFVLNGEVHPAALSVEWWRQSCPEMGEAPSGG